MKKKNTSPGGLSSRIFGRSPNGWRRTTHAAALLNTLLIATACAARAEAPRFDETASKKNGVATLRVKLNVDGKNIDWDAEVFRPERPAAGATLLLDFQNNDDLRALGLARGMTIIRPLANVQSAPSTLREIVPRLKDRFAAKLVIARGAHENVTTIIDAGQAFDGLLIHRRDAFAAPVDPRGPKVIEYFSSDAYWRGVAGADVAEGVNRRRFYITGEFSRALWPGDPAKCTAPLDYREDSRGIAAASRALLVALDEWIRGARRRIHARRRRRTSCRQSLFNGRNSPVCQRLRATSAGFPKIDLDGNETSGLRLPDHVLPIATFIGFNDGKDCAFGAALRFPSTKADRELTKDPRPALVERYGSRAYFVATMRRRRRQAGQRTPAAATGRRHLRRDSEERAVLRVGT